VGTNLSPTWGRNEGGARGAQFIGRRMTTQGAEKSCCWPRDGPEHLNKNWSFQSSIVFLFCRRLHFKELYIHTYIEIVIFTTKKYFLRRALLFLLWVIKLYFCCNKWASELNDVSGARPSGLAIYYRRPELPVFDHFTVENQIDPSMKSTTIRRQITMTIYTVDGSQTMCRGTLLRRQMPLGVPQKILKLKSIK